MPDDQSQPNTGPETPAEQNAPVSAVSLAETASAKTEAAGTETADVSTRPPGAAKKARPPEPREPSAFDADLDRAREGLLDAVAAWLSATWEQPILRAMSSNAGRALENAETFPALRRALRELQSNARRTVDDAIGSLLAPDVQMRDQVLASSIDTAALQLVGMIAAPLIVSGFDPLSGGLERVHDGYRLKAMTEHDEVSAALRAYTAVQASMAAERAERLERDRTTARAEVERLWQATAQLD